GEKKRPARLSRAPTSSVATIQQARRVDGRDEPGHDESRTASAPRLDAHERADLPGPLRPEILIRAGRPPHVPPREILAPREVPRAALHRDRRDLVLPARLAQGGLFFPGGDAGAAEVHVGEDRHLAGALRDRRRGDEGGRLRRRHHVWPWAELHALPVGAAVL